MVTKRRGGARKNTEVRVGLKYTQDTISDIDEYDSTKGVVLNEYYAEIYGL